MGLERNEKGEQTGERKNRADRGQTINDYLLGMILLLLSIALVFGYFPGIFQPFETEVSNEEEAMATNLAAELVDNSTVGESQQTVNLTVLDQTMADFDEDSEPAGIPEWLQWNATVLDSEGEVIEHEHNNEKIQNGSVWRDDLAGSTVRFVSAVDNDDCGEGCRILVRVW